MSTEIVGVLLVIGGQIISAMWIVGGIRADLREAMVRIDAAERRLSALERCPS